MRCVLVQATTAVACHDGSDHHPHEKRGAIVSPSTSLLSECIKSNEHWGVKERVVEEETAASNNSLWLVEGRVTGG